MFPGHSKQEYEGTKNKTRVQNPPRPLQSPKPGKPAIPFLESKNTLFHPPLGTHLNGHFRAFHSPSVEGCKTRVQKKERRYQKPERGHIRQNHLKLQNRPLVSSRHLLFSSSGGKGTFVRFEDLLIFPRKELGDFKQSRAALSRRNRNTSLLFVTKLLLINYPKMFLCNSRLFCV